MRNVTMDAAVAAGDGTLHGAIDYWQEQAALKDLEIMRLREALKTSLNCIDRTGWEFSCDMRLFGKKLDRYKDLYTPTTYDDLMAWHEAQLGEPVAQVRWRNGEMFTKFMTDFVDAGTKLYAKKG